jgi:hypothetical protein
VIIYCLNNMISSGLIWDEETGAFLEPTQISCTSLQTCSTCDYQASKRKSKTPTLSLGCISYLGITYHELDFIYVLNKQDQDAPYQIAQILNFVQDDTTVQVQIRLLRHYDDLVRQSPTSFYFSNWKKDEVLSVIVSFSVLI